MHIQSRWHISFGRKWLVRSLLLLFAGGLGLLALACQGPEGPAGRPGAAGNPGPQAPPGVAGPASQGALQIGAVADRQIDLNVSVSKPANGTHFVTSEQATITVTLKDQSGKAFDRANDFSQLRLMVAGPQETTDTTTAVKLMKTTNDRSQSVHHFVDLMTSKDVEVNGTSLIYKLGAVSDEKPGTYIAAVRANSKAVPMQQSMQVAEFQLGTATAEKQIVEKEKCAACHLGADSGKFYFAHIDPGQPGQPGGWATDQNAVRTCKTCHNNEGYAAFVSPADGKTRIPDQIVNRVHKIHFGEELTNPLDIDPVTGTFKDYTGVIFPANAKNCTSCHVDDRWKTKPSRLACGTCHDQIDWATGKSAVKDQKDHAGGPQANDSACSTCHQADSKSVAPSIAEAHKVEPNTSLAGAALNKIDFSLTPPKNGKFYVAGEKPVLTIVIRDDGGNPVDHTKVSETSFSTASFFVYGPRLHAASVLTNAARNGDSKARASASSSIPGSGTPRVWTFAEGDTFKIAVNGGAVQVLQAPVGAQSADQVRDWLKANLKGDVTITSNNTAGSVNLLSNVIGAPTSRFEIYNSPVTAKMGWQTVGLEIIREGKVVGKTGTTMEPYVVMANVSTAPNDLRPRSDPLIYTDPLVVRSAGNITYQLDDVGTVGAGTYMVYAYTIPSGVLAGTGKGPTGAPNAAAKALNSSRSAIGFMTFQVGAETPDKKVATNCNACHGNTIWHLDNGPIHAEPFDTDYCLACHDYQRFSGTGEGFARVGGTSTSGWAGYGAKPISARVHGVHRGLYLDKAEEIYGNNPNEFAEIVFPQDIRNCGKCHSAETTGTWKTEPSRLACLSCHDSDSARGHGALMTVGSNGPDPYGKDAIETCKTCHGAGKEFSPDRVHNISNPYKPPYPREPEK